MYKLLKSGMENKKGFVNVFITIGVVVVIFVLIACFMTYFQVNHIRTKVINELQYTIYNSIVAVNKEDINLGVYSVDKSSLEQVISVWCKNQIKETVYIKDMNIKDITISKKEKGVNIKVSLDVVFEPIIHFTNSIRTTVTSDYDLSLLEYERNK